MVRRTAQKTMQTAGSVSDAVSEAARRARSVPVRRIPVERIDTPPRPARRLLGDIAALAESMQDYGLQQPIVVRADGDRYILTSGLRRLTAARMLQWQEIPAFVRSVTADQAYLLDLVENLQREDLSAEEEADAFGELMRVRGWTVQQVASSVKRSVGYISKRVRIFDDPAMRQAVTRNALPVSTAEELLAADPTARAELVQRAISERWDQVRARTELRALLANGEPDDRDVVDVKGASSRARAANAVRPTSQVRPKGFAQAIRAFHKQLIEIQEDDFTPADRAALRALFRDLLLLARAPAEHGDRVFPPLPASRGGPRAGRRTRSNKVRTARSR